MRQQHFECAASICLEILNSSPLITSAVPVPLKHLPGGHYLGQPLMSVIICSTIKPPLILGLSLGLIGGGFDVLGNRVAHDQMHLQPFDKRTVDSTVGKQESVERAKLRKAITTTRKRFSGGAVLLVQDAI